VRYASTAVKTTSRLTCCQDFIIQFFLKLAVAANGDELIVNMQTNSHGNKIMCSKRAKNNHSSEV